MGNVEWLKKDMSIFVRLRRTIDIRLERHAPARFLVIILGPNTDEGHVSHIQMGEAAAMLLQDEVVVEAAYSAVTPETFLEAVDIRMNKLTVIPHIHRPTDQGVEKRLSALTAEMHALAGTDHTNWVGGEWTELEKDSFKTGYTLSNFLVFLQKYAMPLVSSIFIALLIKNLDPDWYANLEADHGGGHADEASGGAAAHRLARAVNDTGHESGHGVDSPPAFFNLEIDGHRVTANFIANDILMNFHFAIASEEIVEACLPGGILYPPTKAAANPLGATVGGVLGPIIFFYVFSALFDSGGAFEEAGY